MKIISSKQQAPVEDPFRSKLAMVIPVLEATLNSLARDRIARLGGLDSVTLRDLAREFREGHGDAGICFEYAVHRALAMRSEFIWPLASEVLHKFCKIKDGAQSILFGPEKDGVIPILESVQDALTDDSVVLVGNAGRPPKLKRYIPQIINAYRRNEERNKLPRCITGIWKADLFIGHTGPDQWVGTTVKINPTQLQGAQGLRIGIYPKAAPNDRPRLDQTLNLVRMPLPYDGAFMELFYKAFNLVRAFLKADAEVPTPVYLPDAEDRLLCKELVARKDFPMRDVFPVLQQMSQGDLLGTGNVVDVNVNAVLSEDRGLRRAPEDFATTDSITLAPEMSSTAAAAESHATGARATPPQRSRPHLADLNPNEATTLEFLASAPSAVHLLSIATTCFADRPPEQAYSWARNSVRRLVENGWIAKVGSGTYTITPAGRRKALSPRRLDDGGPIRLGDGHPESVAPRAA